MGKITGFLEYQRLQEASEDKESRKKHYREFVLHLSDEEAKIQGARCMDCGIPFCMSGCPVNNIIPDFNTNRSKYVISPFDQHPNATADRLIGDFLARTIDGCG